MIGSKGRSLLPYRHSFGRIRDECYNHVGETGWTCCLHEFANVPNIFFTATIISINSANKPTLNRVSTIWRRMSGPYQKHLVYKQSFRFNTISGKETACCSCFAMSRMCHRANCKDSARDGLVLLYLQHYCCTSHANYMRILVVTFQGEKTLEEGWFSARRCYENILTYLVFIFSSNHLHSRKQQLPLFGEDLSPEILYSWTEVLVFPPRTEELTEYQSLTNYTWDIS